MKRLRVAIVADLLEEQWPSMDLVADMLMERLRTQYADRIDPTLIRPPLQRLASRVPGASSSGRAYTFDRFKNRLWDYPRGLRTMAGNHDVFHIVDHSYGHLAHELPAARTLVTCHDLDTFRSVLEPLRDPRTALFRRMTHRILDGVRGAGHIACDTEATREALIARAGVPAERTSVVLNGPHPSCTPEPEPAADVEAARLLGPAGVTTDVLHVGSTIARKRIDVLLEVFARVVAIFPAVRLVRVGGPFTAEQRAHIRDLRLQDRIVVLPFLDRSTLASVYRRSSVVLLPSEREGFGLPVLEALACGTAVVASDIDALREVGGDAATYCPPEDVAAWAAAVMLVLETERTEPARRVRRQSGLDRAAAFSWSRYAAQVVALYERLGEGAAG